MPSELPQEFLKQIRSDFTPEQCAIITKSFERPQESTIRVNTIKISREAFENLLTERSMQFEKIADIIDAYNIKNRTVRALTEEDIYLKGYFYIQNPSSMLASLTLDPLPNEHILDMAAAPGSKTTHIAALMKNSGQIIANDVSPARIYKLKANLEKYGVTNTTINNVPGEIIWKTYPEYFDRVLLDAPCSMEGLFKLSHPESFAHWSRKKVKILAKNQKWLLRSAVSSTKKGGIIVYSTCTYSREENEKVVEWILKKEEGKIELIESKRIFPTDYFEGFFIAKFKKVSSSV